VSTQRETATVILTGSLLRRPVRLPGSRKPGSVSLPATKFGPSAAMRTVGHYAITGSKRRAAFVSTAATPAESGPRPQICRVLDVRVARG
jgi:hypothetical protein